MEEIWKEIPRYEGLYSVSNLGRVRRECTSNGYQKYSHLKPLRHSEGYSRVLLFKNKQGKSFFIHFLVLLTFVGPRPFECFCHHIDEDKKNNCLENLKYVTRVENVFYSRDKINLKRLKGEEVCSSKLTEQDVFEIRKLLKEKISLRKIGLMYSVDNMAIHSIKSGRTWKHI